MYELAPPEPGFYHRIMLPTILSQTDPSAQGTGRVIVWIGLLMAAVLVLGFMVLKMRRRLLAEDEPANPESAWTLQDLRTLHARGDLSDEEFEKAKAALILGTRSAPSGHSGTSARHEG